MEFSEKMSLIGTTATDTVSMEGASKFAFIFSLEILEGNKAEIHVGKDKCSIDVAKLRK